MQQTLRRDTKPELAIRSNLHRLGARFRVNRRPLPEFRRWADIVFSRPKVAVFVDGCFWHGCRRHATDLGQHSAFWSRKIERNRERDRETTRLLRRAGWMVIRVWEHEAPSKAVRSILRAVHRTRVYRVKGAHPRLHNGL
jgi:DNA mismatch endonuclease (patch repair protein)